MLFLLDWGKKPELRSRVQAGLNKGESRNALARAVYFNRLGEVRDRSFESQCYRTSDLNLVVAPKKLSQLVSIPSASERGAFYMQVGQEDINKTQKSSSKDKTHCCRDEAEHAQMFTHLDGWSEQ